MNRIDRKQDSAEFAEEADSLWRLTLPPGVWALHFVISYAAVAVVCAKAGGDADMAVMVRYALGGLSVVALALIVWLGWRSWRQWDIIRDRDWENDQGHEEDRHQFLGHAAFLLSIISFIGVSYVSLPLVFTGGCQ